MLFKIFLFFSSIFIFIFNDYGFVGAVAAADGEVHLFSGCSSHCTLDFDKNLDCWNKTLKFYEATLVGGLRQYTGALANIGFWNFLHKRNFDWNTFEDETVNRMKKDEPGNAEDEDSVIEPSDYTTIVEYLVDKAHEKFDFMHKNGNNQDPIPTICPYGCEKSWDPWYWMFLISGGINFILASISMGLVWFLDRRDTEEAKLELAECEIVKMQPTQSVSLDRK